MAKYKVSKRIEVAGCHCLNLPYESKCVNPHGHNWIILVNIEGEQLDPQGMLIDFTHIKRVVNRLDHANVNEVVGPKINPTAENIAEWIANQVQETISTKWHEYAIQEARANEPHGSVSEIEEDAHEIEQFWSIPQVSLITVQEREGNVACYTP